MEKKGPARGVRGKDEEERRGGKDRKPYHQ